MGKSMTILLVDDDEDDRKLFLEAVEAFDHTVQCVAAPGAKEALLYLNTPGIVLPEVIFLDLRMPGMSGQDCLREIRMDARFAQTPIIVYTTSRDEKESDKLKALGASHFMSKPVLPADVYYMVSFALSEKWD
jgi:CheY-like chemotaxis protein